MGNNIHDPFAAFSFLLSSGEGIDDHYAAFQEVSGLGDSESELVLKRGLIKTGSPLSEWFGADKDSRSDKPGPTKYLTLSMRDETGAVLATWVLADPRPEEWTIFNGRPVDGFLTVEMLTLGIQASSKNDPCQNKIINSQFERYAFNRR